MPTGIYQRKPRIRKSLEEYFWPKVDKKGPIPEHQPELGPCWIWIAARTDKGYGVLSDGIRQRGAHVIAWKIRYGLIPEGKMILHKCDNPPCVNTEHLFSGTHSDNMKDCVRKGRHKEVKRMHCAKGHPFVGENLFIRDGKRKCRACSRAWARAYLRRIQWNNRQKNLKK